VIHPTELVLLAGLLYVGSGVGLGLYRLLRRAPRVHLARGDRLPLAGVVLFGGMIGPVLLMVGLTNMPATGASLLLNAEGVFTGEVLMRMGYRLARSAGRNSP
jgi:drug/metabolite transporter (DMT)-like permease